MEAAVEAARTAFKTSWGLKVPGSERGRLLWKLADLIAANLDELAALEALNAGMIPIPRLSDSYSDITAGKRFNDVKHGDLKTAGETLRYFAGWADKNHGQTIEVKYQLQWT